MLAGALLADPACCQGQPGTRRHWPTLSPARPTLEGIERQYIEFVLREVRGRQTRAAAILGISRKALWEKRKRYGLD